MQIITVITQAMDMARRKFTRGEQSMLIDIFNGTALTPGILGQHLIADVEDSFDDMPGEYEEKWGVNRQEMVDKINALSPLDAIFLELWANSFWHLDKPEALSGYLAGTLNLNTHMQGIIARLDTAEDLLERTKNAFKSGQVAEAREIIKEAREIILGII